MHALLSIKPEHVSNIFSGEKRFEYRRRIFARQDVQAVIVYSCRPTAMVVGEFEVAEIITAPIANLWTQTSQYAGISEEYFLSYFEGCLIGHAIRIGELNIYSEPVCLQSIGERIKPPQSYIYIENYKSIFRTGDQGELWS